MLSQAALRAPAGGNRADHFCVASKGRSYARTVPQKVAAAIDFRQRDEKVRVSPGLVLARVAFNYAQFARRYVERSSAEGDLGETLRWLE